MKRILVALLLMTSALTSFGYVYPNFMEAGKYAYADKEYALAKYFFEKALDDIPADSVIEIYIIHNRLRDINKAMFKYRQALNHGNKCIDLMRDLGKSSAYRRTEDYVMLADIYAAMKDTLSAYCYLDSALQCVSAPDTDMLYEKKFATMAGIIYSNLGNWPMAESAYELASMFARRYRPSDDTAVTLNLYGNVLYYNNKYPEARKIYEEQRDLCLKLFGENSKEYQWANFCVANILAYMGEVENGSRIYKDVMKWYKDKIFSDLRSMPESQREAYLDNMIDILQKAIPFGVKAKYNGDDFTRLAYDALLLSKGLLLATENSTDAIIREKGSQEEKESLDRLKAMRAQLSEQVTNPDANPVDILNLYAKIKTIDVKLAKAGSSYGNNMSFAEIDYETVKNGLKDGEVLLDFADFKPQGKPRQYVCYEIRRNQKYPQVHYICNGAELDSLLALENNRWSNLYTGEAGTDMERMVGNPLKHIIGKDKTVYYVPSGIFYKLAIEAIPCGNGVMGDIYTFNQLSSAREIVKERTGTGRLTTRLYGGLRYDTDATINIPASETSDVGKFEPLPRSLEEVTEIAGMLKGSVLIVGNDGSEESFFEMNGNAPDIIHISTHGYYYQPDDANKPASLQRYNDAMSLSGLVMSGGNVGWLGIYPSQGLLTAGEVARCDLSATGLVCLASCYSGQGEVTSEGIYGLQRAFKKAGAGTMIISLWEASDVSTKSFMTIFYSDLVNGSKDWHKAFRLAKKKVRAKYPNPFYWAGFIMVD